MRRRLSLKSEHLVALTPEDLSGIAGANTGLTCVSQATQNEVCDRLVDKIRTLIPR